MSVFLSKKSHCQVLGSASCLLTITQTLGYGTCLQQRVKYHLPETCSQRGYAEQAEARQCKGGFLRAVQDVLRRCWHSTGKRPYPRRHIRKKLAESRNRTQLEMARCLLIYSGLPKMWGATIFQPNSIKNLAVRRGEQKCLAELMRGIKPKISFSN